MLPNNPSSPTYFIEWEKGYLTDGIMKMHDMNFSVIFCSIDFQVLRTEALYWQASNPEDYSCHNFPSFLCYVDSEDGSYKDFYGVPIKEYPGLIKVFAIHICNILFCSESEQNMKKQ